MKVVHLATTDLGGSYKAVERIHKGLLSQGVDSVVLLRTRYHEGSVGEEVVHTPVQKLVSKAKNVGNLLCSKGEIITDRFGTDMSKHPEVLNADVVVIHWVNSFISDRCVSRLVALGKPVVMVAHDMWCCTGGCHYDNYCERYTVGCGHCPMLGQSVEEDLSSRNFKLKQKYYEGVTLVGPSKWSVEVARKSAIWDGHRTEVILNPMPMDIYKRVAKNAIRKKYGVQTDKKIILYGAAMALQNKTKGAQGIGAILAGLDTNKYCLVVFGNREGEYLADIPIETKYLGYIQGDTAMCEVYNMADVFLVPSSQESFCYTVGEALACGIPVVSYGVGGILDQIQHKINGYLAPLGDADEMRAGIEYCALNEMQSIDLHNSTQEIGLKYKELFEELVNSSCR